MKTTIATFLLAAAVLTTPTISTGHASDRAKLFPVPMAQQLFVPVGTLMRVDDGVFDLQIGKSIDLTDRKVLLNISLDREQCCMIRINGEVTRWSIGTRFDLKRESSTKALFADRDKCFLDLVDIIVPKGAPGTATFRLHCI